MKKTLAILIGALCFAGAGTVDAQCTISATAAASSISCGGSVQLTAIPNVPSSITFQDNFNTGTATGWAVTSNPQFNNPCGSSPDGTTYLHMGDQPLGGAPRELTTMPLNITCMGTVCFDFVIQSAFSSPCEDADASNEGIYLQYSTNGTAWTTLTYYDPSLTTNDVWMNICVNIPAGALSPTTQFRWIQTVYSGDTYDHWSLDNIVVTGTCTSTYTPSWAPAAGLSNTGILNPVASPAVTTTYTVTYTDGTNTCTAPVTVTVNGPTADAGLPQSICLGQNVTLNGSGTSNVSGTTTFANTGTLAINDNSTVTSTITVSGLPYSTITTTSINRVCIDSLMHTFDGDLDIYLTCPGGTVLELTTDNGGGGDNYIGTCFTAAATNVIGSTGNTTTPFTGTFAPEGAGGIGAFNGCTANGNWVLSVTDDASLDVGTLYHWSIIFNTPFNPTISWSPSTGMSGSSTFTPTVTPSSTTIYTLTVTSSPGCSAVDTVSVQVGQLTGVTAGTDQTICNGSSTGLSASGGTSYSWNPSTGLSATNIANPVASPSATTDYTVTVSSAGCSGLDTVRVVVNALPNVDAGANTNLCSGTSLSLNATGAVNYSWTPSTALSSTVIANPVATPTSSITYYVTGTDANSCSKTDSIVVTVITSPNAVAGSDTSFCAGGSVMLNASGGGTYSWLPATGLSNSTIANPVANPSATTVYTLTVTGAGGCIDKDTITVTRHTLPTINTTPANQVICAGLSAQLNASGAISYSWLPSGTLNNPNISNPVATPSSNTTYTVTGTDANGCSNTKATTVIVSPGPVVTASADDSICAGGSKNISASSGTSGTYSWLPATGLSSVNTANTLATPTATTVYTVTLTSAAGCKGKDSVLIVVNQLPVAFAGADTAFCAGDSVSLAASGGGSYSWSPATGLSSTTVSNPVATPPGTLSYTLTVTNASGCVDKDTITIGVNALPNVDAGAYQLVCYNAPTQLSASGAANYNWSPATGLSSATVSNPVATLTSLITYTVTGTDANGCFKTDTVTIDVRNPVAVNAGTDDTTCSGNAVQLNATTGGTAYSWNPSTGLSSASVSNPVATPLITTTYTVTLTDANNCNGTDSVTVNVNPLPPANAGADTSFCAGGSVGLAASGGSTYAWSPSTGLSTVTAPNTVASPASSVTYTVTVTDAAGCTNTDSVRVSVNALPAVDAGNNQLVCYNTATQLGASGTGLTAYNWSPATGLSSAAVANPTATLTANITYTVTGTDANGCSNTDTVTIAVRNAVLVDAGLNTAICAGASTTLNATAGGNGYSWLPATGLSSTTVPNPVASPSATTVYTVTLTDANNCNGTDSVTITVNALPVANAGNNTAICAGSTTTLSASGSGSYQWSPAAGLSSSTAASPVATPTATTSYTLSVTNASGCTDTAVVTITVNPLPAVTASGNSPVCSGTSTVLNAFGATSYAWIPTGGLSSSTVASPIASPTTTTNYTVMGFDMNNCADTAIITLVVNPAPVIQVAGASICSGGTATLTATGNASSFSWQPGPVTGLTGATQSVSPAATTVYTVTGTDANNCSATTTATVIVDPLVTAGFTASPSSGFVPLDVSFNNTTTGAANYAWSFGNGSFSTSQNPSNETYQDTGHYVVTLIAFNTLPQCADTATFVITVYPEATLIIPNIFTPNGDNVNDVFKMTGSGIVSADVTIFDRWGKKVISWKDTLAHTWDGGGHGDGTYFYLIVAEELDGSKKEYQGTVQIVK